MTVNKKVQKALEAMRDNADEDERIKEIGSEILAKFAAAGLQSQDGSGTDTHSPRRRQ